MPCRCNRSSHRRLRSRHQLGARRARCDRANRDGETSSSPSTRPYCPAKLLRLPVAVHPRICSGRPVNNYGEWQSLTAGRCLSGWRTPFDRGTRSMSPRRRWPDNSILPALRGRLSRPKWPPTPTRISTPRQTISVCSTKAASRILQRNRQHRAAGSRSTSIWIGNAAGCAVAAIQPSIPVPSEAPENRHIRISGWTTRRPASGPSPGFASEVVSELRRDER